MKAKKRFYGTSVSIALSLFGGIALLLIPEFYPENIVLKEAVCMITIVSLFYSFVSLIFRKIATENEKEHQLILQSIMPLSSGLSAKYYYPASDQPNVEFNTIIDEEICVTKNHFYFSNKAFFHTSRLLRLINKIERNSKFLIVLPDIREQEIINAMADNLIEVARVKGEKKEKNYYIKKARLEIYCC